MLTRCTTMDIGLFFGEHTQYEFNIKQPFNIQKIKKCKDKMCAGREENTVALPECEDGCGEIGL